MKKKIHEHYTVPKHAPLPPICICVEWLQRALANHKRAVVNAAAKANGDLIRQVVDQVRVQVNVKGSKRRRTVQLMTSISDADTEPRLCLSGEHGIGRTSILANLVLQLLPKGQKECSVKCAAKGNKAYRVCGDGRKHFEVFSCFVRCSFI